jgi:hypothetical protein
VQVFGPAKSRPEGLHYTVTLNDNVVQVFRLAKSRPEGLHYTVTLTPIYRGKGL